jgi:hypothetical protein
MASTNYNFEQVTSSSNPTELQRLVLLSPIFTAAQVGIGRLYTGTSPVTYLMRAKTISGSPPYIYWNVVGTPDTTGIYSGHTVSDLTDIIVQSRLVT